MTEIVPPTVRDTRAFPGWTLPPTLRMWLMVSLALGILVVILAFRGPAPSLAPATTTPPPAADGGSVEAAQVQDLRARLAAGLARGQDPRPLEPRADAPRPQSGASALAPGAAPLPRGRAVADRDETLFASNVVVRGGKADIAPAVPATARDPDLAGVGRDATPSLDEITRSVMRAIPPAQPPASPPPAIPVPAAAGAGAVPPAVAAGATHLVFEGTILDGVLVTRLEGSFEGPANVLLSSPLYAQDLTLVAPAGSRVLGTAKAVSQQDASKLAVAFHRLILPSGRDVSLDQFTGLSQRGDAGVSGRVNRHYLSTFGAAAAIGLISGLSQSIGAGFGNDSSRTVVIAGGIGDATSQAANQVLARFLNRLPSISVEGGTRVKVYLTSDLHLPAY